MAACPSSWAATTHHNRCAIACCLCSKNKHFGAFLPLLHLAGSAVAPQAQLVRETPPEGVVRRLGPKNLRWGGLTELPKTLLDGSDHPPHSGPLPSPEESSPRNFPHTLIFMCAVQPFVEADFAAGPDPAALHPTVLVDPKDDWSGPPTQ